MPIEYKKVEGYTLVPEVKKCNRCKKEFRDTLDDMVEWQEFVHIEFEGGFGSIFGDEAKVECDLCQICFRVVLGEYLEIGPNWFERATSGEKE